MLYQLSLDPPISTRVIIQIVHFTFECINVRFFFQYGQLRRIMAIDISKYPCQNHINDNGVLSRNKVNQQIQILRTRTLASVYRSH